VQSRAQSKGVSLELALLYRQRALTLRESDVYRKENRFKFSNGTAKWKSLLLETSDVDFEKWKWK
jgi:hypothetical protein